ncbi:hypothetical protein P7D52_13200 [Enterococcus dongliensis]|uniref:Uncharacterized protein n=1 Tax=Enterococcus dongliensis TaxID=2559925 RepID=A0ABU3ET78_9ENTE|nr:hypothetical protein [Enterococcus dongliensis]MDT2598070.1 hypothetical protein [Enterococcus dongliensis]MDT2643736.1 hypothetical protein [Enterococcus dongliensis]
MTFSLIENLNLLEKEIQKKKQGQPTHLNKFSIDVIENEKDEPTLPTDETLN